MMFDPEIYRRRSIRLHGYDYTQPGVYFVTVCTHQRECFLGEIAEGEARLSVEGAYAQAVWLEIPRHYARVSLDEYVVMPNHFHGIIMLDDPSGDGNPYGLPEVVRGFKTFSARAINRVRDMPGAPVWQRNYYEHIVRGDEELSRIRDYIAANPGRWAEDQDNPVLWRPKG